MNQSLLPKTLDTIDYDKEWKKTLLYKFGKKTPSENWKKQLYKIYQRKYNSS